MDFFKINRKAVKSPTSIEHSFEVLDKAERTMDGTMVVDVVGKKMNLSVSWDYLLDADMRLIASELNSSTFVEVTFNDKQTGELVTITGHPKSFKYSPAYDWVHNKVMWQNISVTFEER